MPTFTCPTCAETLTVSRIEDALFRPFCSKRCKLVDLGRWLDGTYRVNEPQPPDALRDEPQDDALS